MVVQQNDKGVAQVHANLENCRQSDQSKLVQWNPAEQMKPITSSIDPGIAFADHLYWTLIVIFAYLLTFALNLALSAGGRKLDNRFGTENPVTMWIIMIVILVGTSVLGMIETTSAARSVISSLFLLIVIAIVLTRKFWNEVLSKLAIRYENSLVLQIIVILLLAFGVGLTAWSAAHGQNISYTNNHCTISTNKNQEWQTNPINPMLMPELDDLPPFSIDQAFIESRQAVYGTSPLTSWMKNRDLPISESGYSTMALGITIAVITALTLFIYRKLNSTNLSSNLFSLVILAAGMGIMYYFWASGTSYVFIDTKLKACRPDQTE